MKYLLPILLLCISLTLNAQTKGDVLDCLSQIFEHRDFEPAYDNSVLFTPDLLILKRDGGFRSGNQNGLASIFFSTVNEDFHDFHSRVEFAREEDLEALNIFKESALSINAALDSDNLAFRISTVSTTRRLRFIWRYSFVKENDSWVLLKHDVKSSKNGVRL